jgi:hypothetical protein
VREANCGSAALLGHFKDDVGILPLALVLDKAKVVVHGVPNNLLPGTSSVMSIVRR